MALLLSILMIVSNAWHNLNVNSVYLVQDNESEHKTIVVSLQLIPRMIQLNFDHGY